MKASLGQLRNLLENNVLEVLFVRRIPVPHRSPTRRMLCTNALRLLSSHDGRITLNFRPATHLPKYNPAAKGLIITWDILMQDYRQINAQQCEIVNQVPVEQFWDYFRAKIAPLTTEQKLAFMDV